MKTENGKTTTTNAKKSKQNIFIYLLNVGRKALNGCVRALRIFCMLDSFFMMNEVVKCFMIATTTQ